MSRCSRQINGFISATEVEKRIKRTQEIETSIFHRIRYTSFGCHSVFRDIVLYIFDTQNNVHGEIYTTIICKLQEK